jgi:exopolysaccharide biosynthesis polyprenyl glycosylphosphotransferase
VIRRYEAGFRLSLMLADAAIAGGVIVALSIVRFGGAWAETWPLLVPVPGLLLAAYIVAWIALLARENLYQFRARWSIRSEATSVGQATLLHAMATLTVLVLFRLDEVSRLFLLVLFPTQAAVVTIARAALRLAFRRSRWRGRNVRKVVVVGAGAAGRTFADKLEQRFDLGLRVIGFVDRARPPDLRGRFLGSIDELPTILHNQVVDEVAICLPREESHLAESVAVLAADEGKIVRIPIEVPALAMSTGHVEDLSGTPVLSLVSGPDRLASLAVKRTLDVVGAAVGLVLLSPLFLTVALAIVATDGRPVLFRQERAGLHGRRFRVVKFRTMARDADGRRAELRAAHNEVQGAAFKMTDDPRVTPLGRSLRRTSIDELPQLWNVLRGDMSLVGPRPHPFDDIAGYDIWHRRRLSMKPGITGLWQVGARSDPDFDRWVQMDLEYIDRWSLVLDLRVMLQTIPALLRATGR